MSTQLPPPPPYSRAPLVSEPAGGHPASSSSRPAHELLRNEWHSDVGRRSSYVSQPVGHFPKQPPPPPPPSRPFESVYGNAGAQQPLHPLYYSDLDPQAAPAHIVYAPKSLPHYAPVEPGPYSLPEILTSLPPAPSRRSAGVSPSDPSQTRTLKKITQRRETNEPSHRSGRHASRKSLDDRQIQDPTVILKHEESTRKPSVASIPPAYPHKPSPYPVRDEPVSEAPLAKKSHEALHAFKPSIEVARSDPVRSRHSMSISGLISSDETPVAPSAKSDETSMSRLQKIPPFCMIMRQQPIAARACGFGERDRRVIDPPPILQVFAKSRVTGADDENPEYWPASVVHCSLWHADEDRDDTIMPESSDRKQQRRLMGTLVSSPFIGLDEHGVEGCFFTFPDLSCRTSGRYRLRMVLTCIEPNAMQNFSLPFRSVVISDIFCVYAAKDFPGMRTSTPLTKKLKDQGCLISVKKGSDKTDKPRKKKSKAQMKAGSGSEDNSDADSETSTDEEGGETSGKKSRSRPKKKAKQFKD